MECIGEDCRSAGGERQSTGEMPSLPCEGTGFFLLRKVKGLKN